jgi:hypothetical protein
VWPVIASSLGCRSRRDRPDFEQLEAERLDLGNDAEQRRTILEQAGEHGLAALPLRRHRGKGGERGGSELAPYPDRVQAQRRGHAIILQRRPVRPPRRNPVIVLAAAR